MTPIHRRSKLQQTVHLGKSRRCTREYSLGGGEGTEGRVVKVLFAEVGGRVVIVVHAGRKVEKKVVKAKEDDEELGGEDHGA